MDIALYRFMFPTAILVATTAMLSGIGGAADQGPDVHPEGARSPARPPRTIHDRSGREYTFPIPRQGLGALATSVGAFLTAVPWNLVLYTIPGVLIGGQLGPLLQGRISQHVMVRGIGLLFMVIVLAMAWIVLNELGIIPG